MSAKNSLSLRDTQKLTDRIYGENNKRHFTIDEMLTNVERYIMRALKGIRKGDRKKIEINLVVGLSWFMSAMNQLGVDLEDNVWHRFSYSCSYCGEAPCVCGIKKIQKRIGSRVRGPRPKNLRELQTMFGKIYPSSGRTLEHAGVHMAEETGELGEAVLRFRGSHTEKDFKSIEDEASDLFSCVMGVFNSLGTDYAHEFDKTFSKGCHVCHKIPCACDYQQAVRFKS